MSHNVLLQNIKFTDISVLRAAFNELVKETPAMAGFELVETATTVRGWLGRTTKVDMAIKCSNQMYDIGFVKGPDGSYTPMLEHGFNAPGVAADIASQTVQGEACRYGHENMALGKLQQRYGVRMAEDNARKQGFMTRRVTDVATGHIQLHVQS